MKKLLSLSALMSITFYIYFAITYIINLVQFFKCDFASPYKDEIIHGIGVFIPPLNCVTVWL